MEVRWNKAADHLPDPMIPVAAVLLNGAYDVVYWSKGFQAFQTVRNCNPSDAVVYWHPLLGLPHDLQDFLNNRNQLLSKSEHVHGQT
jgi:hypothetical protein